MVPGSTRLICSLRRLSLTRHGEQVRQAIAVLVPVVPVDDLPLAVAHAGEAGIGIELELGLPRQSP